MCQGTNIICRHALCWNHLSPIVLHWSCQPSRPDQQMLCWFQLFTYVPPWHGTSAYLCAKGRIGARTRRLDHPSSVLLPQKVITAFHVPAFQRNHRKRLSPFSLERSGSNSRRNPLSSSFAHTHYVSSPMTRSKSPTMGWSVRGRQYDRSDGLIAIVNTIALRSHSMALTLLCKLYARHSFGVPHGPDGPPRGPQLLTQFKQTEVLF